MTELNCIEIPLDYSVATCSRATPFHWALLTAVQTFPAGDRPDFAAIAERLHFHEPAFLAQAWIELCDQAAVTHKNFNQAELHTKGHEALRLGYLLTSEVNTRRVTLVFGARGDRCVERREFDLIQGARLRTPPVWADALDIERVLTAMSFQMPSQMPAAGERIIELKLRWAEAHEAVATW